MEGRNEGVLCELGGRREIGGVGRRCVNDKGVVRSIISSSARVSGCGQTKSKSVLTGNGDSRIVSTCFGVSLTSVCVGGVST